MPTPAYAVLPLPRTPSEHTPTPAYSCLPLPKACEYIGIDSLSYEQPEETTQEELLELIGELNARRDVNGILVQLPVPGHIDEAERFKSWITPAGVQDT